MQFQDFLPCTPHNWHNSQLIHILMLQDSFLFSRGNLGDCVRPSEMNSDGFFRRCEAYIFLEVPGAFVEKARSVLRYLRNYRNRRSFCSMMLDAMLPLLPGYFRQRDMPLYVAVGVSGGSHLLGRPHDHGCQRVSWTKIKNRPLHVQAQVRHFHREWSCAVSRVSMLLTYLIIFDHI